MTRRPEQETSVLEPSDPEKMDRFLQALGLVKEPTSAGLVWTRKLVDSIPAPEALPSFAGFFTHAEKALPLPKDLLFLDAETTGLAGGTGTVAFLVGLSWWTDQGFETVQVFLSSPGQESAQLEIIRNLAQKFSVVVTFNGASFDLPLLRTRALMNRTTDPLAALVSWDLLVPARRVWGRMLSNCRQQTLEESICGLSARKGDIDGSKIPAVWFDFLAGSESELLERVLHHNHLDMLGMAHLFKKVVGQAERVAGIDSDPGKNIDWREAWSLGRICEKSRGVDESIYWLKNAVRTAQASGPGSSPGGTGPWPDPRFLADAIRILKRSGDWLLVEKLIHWGLMESPSSLTLHREATILYERRLTNLEKALAHALLCAEDGRVTRLKRKLMEVTG